MRDLLLDNWLFIDAIKADFETFAGNDKDGVLCGVTI